jgi:hypothetical protein
MLKQLVCAALLTCSFGAHANYWQQEFFSPLSNELPASRGVAVDDLGYVHLQAYNRHDTSVPNYFLAHQYTIRSDGQIPWGWDVSPVNRMSDCGVYAKAGQRLDCKRSTRFWGEETHLEMRGNNNAYVVWENTLPDNVTLLDASIPQQNEALVLGRIDSPNGAWLGVYRIDSQWPPYPMSIALACAPSGTLLDLRAAMPKQPGEPIRVVKACQNSFGSTDLSLEELDPQSGVWNTRSTWYMPLNTWVTHMDIGPQGQPYVMVQDDNYTRSLLTVPQFIGQWVPLPIFIQDKVAGFFVGHQGLAIVNVAPRDGQFSQYILGTNPEYSISWYDTDSFWPIIHYFGEFEDLEVKAFALSSDGDVIVLGSPMYTSARIDRLLLARRDRELLPIGISLLQPDETAVGTTYLIGGPNNTAVVARTISRDQGFGNSQVGIRVNQYDLPPVMMASKHR